MYSELISRAGTLIPFPSSDAAFVVVVTHRREQKCARLCSMRMEAAEWRVGLRDGHSKDVAERGRKEQEDERISTLLRIRR